MQNNTIGILAHVDAGKTTLSEQLLCRCGVIRSAGRVDHGNTVMDSSEAERARGITIFSDQCAFSYRGRPFTLIDTPGHADFAAEAERSLDALDCAILLQDASDPIRPHTLLLAEAARRRGIPCVLFLNKCDLASADPDAAAAAMAERLALEPIEYPFPAERLAELDEPYMEAFLEGDPTEAERLEALRRAFASGTILPVLRGSALGGIGISELLEALCLLLPELEETPGPTRATVYKIRRDEKGRRCVFVRVHSGSISPRDIVCVGEERQKLSELRTYSGARYESVPRAAAGAAVALLGLSVLACGDLLEARDGMLCPVGRVRPALRSALAAAVTATDGTDRSALMRALKELEDEDPQLSITVSRSGELLVHVMGPIQPEILQGLLLSRYGIRVAFSEPRVQYLETIAAPVRGCGHYEPLRHYAEVILRLEPGAPGSGITFSSECHVDDLTLPWQKSIEGHLLGEPHIGVLTGSPLTDVRLVLTAGRAHLKHTEGADFREAARRAVRHGLRCGRPVLLEPMYRFELAVPQAQSGRVLSDLRRLFAECEPPETMGNACILRGRGPVATLAAYGIELRSVTHGEGSASFTPDGYAPCHDAEQVIAAQAYSPDADTENPCGSVFCAHGAGYHVPWEEAEQQMHCLRRD